MRAMLWLCAFFAPVLLAAAPLNKFGSMVPQAPPVAMQQQAAPAIGYAPPPLDIPAKPAPTSKDRKKSEKSLESIRRILSKLSTDKVRQWQARFEKKRRQAEESSKRALRDYYAKLVALCEQLLRERKKEEATP